MLGYPVIQLRYRTVLPQRIPGRKPITSTSVIQFLDLDGKMAALNGQATTDEARSHVLKLLNRSLDSIHLRMGLQTKSHKSFVISSEQQVKGLIQGIKKAVKVWYVVRKSK
jgi:hypothetical protein